MCCHGLLQPVNNGQVIFHIPAQSCKSNTFALVYCTNFTATPFHIQLIIKDCSPEADFFASEESITLRVHCTAVNELYYKHLVTSIFQNKHSNIVVLCRRWDKSKVLWSNHLQCYSMATLNTCIYFFVIQTDLHSIHFKGFKSVMSSTATHSYISHKTARKKTKRKKAESVFRIHGIDRHHFLSASVHSG